MVVAARNMEDIGLSAYDNTDTLQLHEPSTDGKTTLTLVSAGNGYNVKWTTVMPTKIWKTSRE